MSNAIGTNMKSFITILLGTGFRQPMVQAATHHSIPPDSTTQSVSSQIM